MQLTAEQRQVQELAREFAEGELRPHVAAWDRAGRLPPELRRQLGELGFWGMALAEDADGLGLDPVSVVLVLEELARGEAGVALWVNIHAWVSAPLLAEALAERLRPEWLPAVGRGEALLAFALTEPEAGSDARALSTVAEPEDGGWRLRGRKAWVTQGAQADAAIVFARSSDGIDAFLVPTDTPGYRIGERERTLGHRTLEIVTVDLDDLRLPADHRLGAAGSGWTLAKRALVRGRLGAAAIATGIAQAALDHSLRYAAERTQFGRPIADFEGMQFKLADMAIRLEAARSLTRRAAAALAAQDPSAPALASMAKTFASEAAMAITTEAIQVFGGYGYMRDYPVERLFRDAKATELYEGANDIQRVLIARALIHQL